MVLRISAELLGPCKQFPGYPLKKGDVLYVRRWSAGLSSALNLTVPPHTVDRIPLRHVGVGGQLREYEIQLLVDFLLTNRTDRSPQDVVARKAAMDTVTAHAVDMWNAFVDGLHVGRSSTNDGLVITANYYDVLEKGQLAKRSSTDCELEPGVKYFRDPLKPYVELTAIDGPYPSAFAAIGTTQGGSNKNRDYYVPGDQVEHRLFTFASVDLDGVDMRAPGLEESRWTLRDLEQSGVCADLDEGGAVKVQRSIEALRVTGSGKTFWLVDDNAGATHKLQIQNHRQRTLVNAGGHTWLAHHTLNRSVLHELAIRDATDIYWRSAHGSLTRGPAHCEPR